MAMIVTPQPTQIDQGVITRLTITGANNIIIRSEDPQIIQVNNIEERTIIGLKQGSTRITVIDLDGNSDPVTWLCEVVWIDTILEISRLEGPIRLGKEQQLTVTTNADKFTVTSSDRDIVRPKNSESPLVLYAIGLGEATVTITAQKKDRNIKTWSQYIEVSEAPPINEDEGISVGVRLVNDRTQRTVNITTTDNMSTNDVTVYLPTRSGTLLTKEDISSQVRMVTQPRIISPVNGTEGYTGYFQGSTFMTALGYQGKHTSTMWQVATDKAFSNIVIESTIRAETTNDLTKAAFPIPFGKYYVRVAYVSEPYVSLWSSPLEVTMYATGNIDDSGLDEYIKKYDDSKDFWEGSYFGIIPFNKLIDNYHYRGNIMSMRKWYRKDRYYAGKEYPGTRGDISGVMHQTINFEAGEQVTYKNKLYYATDKKIIPLKDLGPDSMDIPTWDKLEGLYKHKLMVKYLPLTIQTNKKFVIEIYTDAEEIDVMSDNEQFFVVEPGITRNRPPIPSRGEDTYNPEQPNGTDATGAKFYTLVGKAGGSAALIIRTKVQNEETEEPTYFKRKITVNGYNIAPMQPTTLVLDGVKDVVSQSDPTYTIQPTLPGTLSPTYVQPDIRQVDDSYYEYTVFNANGWYEKTSTVTMEDIPETKNKKLTFSNNGNFYVQLNIPNNGTTGYATSTFWITRAYGWPSVWAEDKRKNIISPRSLLDKIGIGHGITDNNYNQATIDGVKVGDLINSEEGIIKYYHGGRLCYMNLAPIIDGIAWNDIAMRETGYKQRTIRVGGNLYWVRLPYKDELKQVLTSMMDGKYESKSLTDLKIKPRVSTTTPFTESDDPTNRTTLRLNAGGGTVIIGSPVRINVTTNADTFNVVSNTTNVATVTKNDNGRSFTITGLATGQSTITVDATAAGGTKVTRTINITVDNATNIWTLDEKTGPTRTILYHSGTAFIEDELDPKSRRGSLMFVMEYIPEHQAPYNNLDVYFPNAILADNELFQYDPYTDTGYFGVISENRFITGDGLYTSIGWTGGSSQFNGTGHWLKFYWHGQIVITDKRTHRYNVSQDNARSNNCLYGFDTGGSGLTTITIKDCEYRVCTGLNVRMHPLDRSHYFTMGNGSTKTLMYFGVLTSARGITGVACGPGEYSMWNELMPRLTTGYMGYTDVNGREWYYSYTVNMDQTAGLQIGDNWAEFPVRNKIWYKEENKTDPLQINYDKDGNGTGRWGRESSNGSCAAVSNHGVIQWNAVNPSYVAGGGNTAFIILVKNPLMLKISQ